VNAKGKKEYDKTPWKTALSSFDRNKNSLMIPCGRSNLCVIDVDVKAPTGGVAAPGGMDAWNYFETKAGGPFETFTVTTGTGGKHIYFTQDGLDEAPWNGSYARCFKIDGKAVDIDVRGLKAMVFAAPSSYTDGAGQIKQYTVTNASAPMKMPATLLKLLTEHTDNNVTNVAGKKSGGKDKRTRAARAASVGGAAGAPADAATAAAGAPASSVPAGAKGASALDESTIEDVFQANKYLTYICAHAGEKAEVDVAVWANHQTFVRLAWAACNLSEGSTSSVGLYKPLMRLNAKYTELRDGEEREDAHALWESTDRNRADVPGLQYIEQVYKEYLRKFLPPPLGEQQPGGADQGDDMADGSEFGPGQNGATQVNVQSALEALIRHVHTQLGLFVSDVGVASLISSVKLFSVYEFGLYVCDVLSTEYRYGNDMTQTTQGAGAYFFDGARYVFKSLVANLNYYAQRSIVSVLQTLLDKSKPSSPGYESRVPIADREVKALEAILCTVKNKGYEAIWSHVSKLIQSDHYYLDRGLLTPTEFFEKLDESPYLIGFNNGVFDMQHYKFYPKGAVPPDVLVSYTTKYDYIGDANGGPKDDEQARKMEEVERETYWKFFPDETTRKHAQAFCGLCLTSGNLKKLALFVGQAGDNGKTNFAGMYLKATFGDYAGVMDPAVLTDDRDDADKPNPSLSLNRKRKIVVVNEGHNKKVLNASRTKTLTGNDLVSTRKLYGQPVESTFNAKIIWVGNEAPKVNGDDEALMKRMLPLAFTARFGNHDDDPVRGLWRASESHVMMEKYKIMAPFHMLLLIRYSRTTTELPDHKTGNIIERMLEDTPLKTLADFLSDYEHTNADGKAALSRDTTISIQDLLWEYKSGSDVKVDLTAFLGQLAYLKVRIKTTPTRSNGINANKLAWLRRKPAAEAQPNDSQLADSALEQEAADSSPVVAHTAP
jgi:hypothetical protein